MYPLLLNYYYENAVWGGNNISKILNFPEEKSLATAVMFSFDRRNTVKNGSFKGKSISTVQKEFFGKKTINKIPFNVKMLDSFERMPIGVSDCDRVFYIAKAKSDSEMIFGFSHNLDSYELERRIGANTLYSACNCIPVKTGQFVFVKKGTLHALGKNILAYLVYSGEENFCAVSDYGRTDANGEHMPLQIEKAKQIINLAANEGFPDLTENTSLYPFGTVIDIETDYSSVSLLNINGTVGIDEKDSFCAITVSAGELVLSYASGTMNLKCGDLVLVPADMKVKLNGFATVLCTKL